MYNYPSIMSIERRTTTDLETSERIQKSLTYCWKEGVAAQVMLSILDYYLIPFALYLGASTLQVGVLIALPVLLSSISQFSAVKAVYIAGNRLRLILFLTAL